MLLLWKRELGLWNQGGGGPVFVKILKPDGKYITCIFSHLSDVMVLFPH